MSDIFDTLTDKDAPPSGDIFDQLEGKQKSVSSLAPAQPGEQPFSSTAQLPPQFAGPAPIQPQIPGVPQFQQELAEKGELMQRTPKPGLIELPLEFMGWTGDLVRAAGLDLAHGLPPSGQPRGPEGNVHAVLEGEELPADKFIAEHAKYAPNLAVAANLGQDLVKMAPMAAMGALPAWANRLIAAGFSIDMIKNAGPMATELGTEMGLPKDQQDAGKIAKLKSGLIQSAVFAPLAGAGATHGLTIPEFGRGAEAPVMTPEARVANRQQLLQRAKDRGQPITVTDRPLARPSDVANTLPDGSVVINEPNFHGQLEMSKASGVPVAEAIDNIINHESIHSAIKTIKTPEGAPAGDDIALGFWDNMTGVEKSLFKRKLHGPDFKGRPYTDLQYGQEAIRFALERLGEGKPGEHIFGTAREIRTSKVLTALENVIRWIRENIGRTKASAKNIEYLDQLQAHLDKLKKGSSDASGKQTTAEVHGDVQPLEAPTQGLPVQEGGAGVQPQAEGVAQEAQVPLKPGIHVDVPKPDLSVVDKPVTEKEFGKYDSKNFSVMHAGTDLNTGEPLYWIVKKVGSLKSANPKEAPPTAPTGEAQPAAPVTGKGKPRGKARVEPAKASISTAFSESKSKRLDALSDKLLSKDFDPDSPQGRKDYDEYIKLSDEVAAAEKDTIRGEGTRPERIDNPDTTAYAMTMKEPKDISERLGLRYRGTMRGIDQYVYDEPNAQTGAPSGITISVPQGTDLAGVKAKMDQRMAQYQEPLAMSMKARYRGADGNEKELEVQPGEWVVTVQKKDGSTYEASYKGQTYEIPKGMASMFDGKTQVPAIGKPTDKGWSHGMLSPGEKIIEGEQPPLAMSMKKGARTPEEEVVARVISTVGGVGKNKQKEALVKDVVGQILAMPKEHWGPALTQFHSDWHDQIIADAAKRMEREGLAKALNTPVESLEMGEKLTPEAIQAALGEELSTVDRQGAYRNALYVLNKPVVPIHPGGEKTKSDPLGTTPEAKVGQPVRPSYNYGDYKEFWEDFHERHPNIPEQMAVDVWNNAVDDVLTNASGERIKELLRPARLEKRFLGEGLLRTIPDIDPDPILDSIANAPDPTQSVKFRKFLAARDLTPEQGVEALKQLRAKHDQELRGAKEMLEGTTAEKKLKTRAGEEVLPAGREGLGEGERRDLFNEWRKGRALNLKRRIGAVSELAKWLKKQAALPEKDPMRRTIGAEDIWFETKEPGGAYAEYGKKDGENAAFLRSALGQGGSVGGKSASKFSRSVAVVVKRDTGDYNLVSVYVRDGQPMIYDPSGPAGSKTKGFVSINNLLADYRVVGHLLVKDPLYHLHQRFITDKTSTGEQKFNEAMGEVARARENAASGQWMRYVRESEAERRAELKRQHDERFFGKTTEEEVTGEEAVPEEKAGTEEPEEGKETTREEGLSDADRERMARQREEAGGRPWEEAEEFDIGRGVTPASRAALQAWQAAVATGKEMVYRSGRQAVHLFESDLRHLAESPLTGPEAESLHEIIKSYKVKHPLDMQRMLDNLQANPFRGKTGTNRGRDISAMYAMDKIANRIYERMRGSAYEQAKLKGLPEIPKDTEYVDMTEGEKAHYVALESLKYRALLRTFHEVYEIANEARNAPAGKGAATERLAVSPDTEAFRARALDRYGDTARRDTEQAALSAQRGVEITAPKRGPIPVQGGVTAGKRFPRVQAPPAMLPEGAAKYVPEPPGKGTFPNVPTTSSNIGGEGFTGQPPARTPEIAQPVPYGSAEKGFVPRSPSRRERLTMSEEEFAKLRREERPPQLREPKGSQLLMRKIMQQSTEDPLAMTMKGYGPSRRAQEEMVGQGRALPRPVTTNPIVTKDAQIAEGRELVVDKKVNPVKEMALFEKTEADHPGAGLLSVNGAGAIRYWGFKLQEWADNAVAKFGANSPEAKAAMKRSDEWQRKLEGSVGQQFNKLGIRLQGWNQIGPNDMRSTTFIRRFLKKAKAKLKGMDEDDFELDEEDEATVQRMAREVTRVSKDSEETTAYVGKKIATADDPVLDEGNQRAVSEYEAYLKDLKKSASSALKRGKPDAQAMAMKGEEGELPPLDPYVEDLLGNAGMTVMSELSKVNDLTDSRWLEEMKKYLNSDDVQRPDLEPYLPHIRAISEEIRQTAINNVVGTGSPFQDARKIFTRKRPPVENSIEAIHRAIQADPTGEKISPAEAFHIWNYLRARFFDKNSPSYTLDFKEIRTKASAELGIKEKMFDPVLGKEVEKTVGPYTQLRLFRAMASNRSMRMATEELVKKMRDEARIKGQAMNWLKNQQYPGWLRTMRLFPRLFFFDKILGHGLVPMITHAPTMMFNPMAWGAYFGKPGQRGAWAEMYKMTGLPTQKGQLKAEAYHQSRMAEMTNHEHFEAWKEVDLQCDPFKHTDDYQIEALQRVLGKRFEWLTAGRGFDALKTLRYAMAEKWLKSLPEHLQNPESMKLIADSVNHATGIVKTNFHEAFNWAMFAPKLEASRWAYLFKDTVKAADIVRKWQSSSLEQRAWATRELKQKAMVVGIYYGMLALNQAFLKMSGSDEDINAPFLGKGADPRKADFMSFKVAGFKVGVAGPLIGVFKLIANALHAAAGERTKFEKLTSRQKQLMQVAGQYARGKASPLASFAIDAATAQDYSARPIGFLPWSEPLSRNQRLQGATPYGGAEYALETFSPIPLEEAIKETWKSQGMDGVTASSLIKALIIAGGMSLTGARIQSIEK